MYKTLEQIRNDVKKFGKTRVCVAGAHDEQVIMTIKEAYEEGFADAILVGDKAKIEKIMSDLDFCADVEIIDEPDDKKAALIASGIVRNNKAKVLMKGLINSSDFLKAVLNDEVGLKTGRQLSHLAAFELPKGSKLMFHTDGGMNISPDLQTKKQIVINAVEALQKLGINEPKVAILTANEIVNPKMPSTVDAADLVKMNECGEINNCIIEGPIALDVALSKESAKHKGIKSRISGDVDLFVVPNIEAGNMVGKTLIYCADAKMAGIVLGASNPIVMASRADNAIGKLNSLALACMIS